MLENLQNTISHIWNVFVTSNLFNFTVFVAVFVWIFKKFNLMGLLESVPQKIAYMIETAKKAKEDAKKELGEAEKAVENLTAEIDSIIQDAEKSAEVIAKKLLEDAKKQVTNIEGNVFKIVNAEEKMLISKLTRGASTASVKVATSHIQNALAQNPELHDKFINESIDSLDRLNF